MDLHNSNKPLVQITLTGEKLMNEKSFCWVSLKPGTYEWKEECGLRCLILDRLTY